MAARLLAGLMLACLAAPVSLAAPALQVALAGDHRALRASTQDVVPGSFEQELAERLAASLQRPVAVGDSAAADLIIGPQEQGAIFYQSEMAALTAAQGGIERWDQLREKPFCVTQGSPYGPQVVERFGGRMREYPSAAHALIGLKLGECQAVVDDNRLLADIAPLPEWQRYNRLLPAFAEVVVTLRAATNEAALQTQVGERLETWRRDGSLDQLIQHWIDEVAFQAYVLADTLDCH
ncbi:transporter substrate-binding domain-containing protein [Stutzerimonas azotifigens]|uniref:Transporter substrate-binding domain-containing protein n=1 Tax=Stutzerimonas azotifigens TaxID=291995 RepID=A0ABR5YY50_9GAMM|nr:transporter substrate-binding domain-containing protein [Stutzerimonas azotifigens]MBA1272872.1 transporter substrate-binding domain-containing protein [Stutzerimonas azotifigens]